MSQQLEDVLADISGESPVGSPDIESEEDYQALLVAAAGKAEKRMGDSVIAAEPPDWKSVDELSRRLLGKSKHVALLVHLIKARASLDGFSGLQAALSATLSLLDQHWDALHPIADADDPDDPYWERVNLLREISDSPDFVDLLHRTPVVDVRHIGRFSCRDMDIAANRLSVTDEEEKERCNPNLIRGAFTESEPDQINATASAMLASVESLRQFEKLFAERSGDPTAVALAGVIGRVTDFHAMFVEQAGSIIAAPAVEVAEDADAANAADSSAAGGDTAAQESTTVQVPVTKTVFTDRHAVAAAFDSLVAYYAESEPSSPVPVLLVRARQMVYKSFFDILQELAPASKDNFRSLMAALRDDPLGFLIEDSYTRFMSGETVTAAESAESGTDNDGDAQVATLKVGNRQQVVATLADIQAFFEQHEPSSPVPLIVTRVRNLVPKNFLDLLAEFDQPDTAESSSE